ncbi:MAG: transglycosylase SLT domain-containing protein [Bacteroidetes bacterium]|nr:transglycosylase SLT domain-containing protein [Bacteroidota bacterium]MBU1115125.1 transglycosylase SLT domain-containing protein [Bacteroidota bacterium]MBU1799264.1 transglycosylase SLT domain-containing protein [Bacteroidota bacterium]
MSDIGLKITNNSKHIAQPQTFESTKTPKEKAKLAKAAQDFESMLTSMMLKSMNQTTGGMFGEGSFGGDYFDTIFETKIASFISEKKSLGLADMIYKKVIGEDLDMNKIKQEMQSENTKSIKIEASKAIKNEAINDSVSISPSKGSVDRLSKFDDIITKASESYNIDKNLIRSVILTESAANPKALSKANAKGLMQLIDSTASDMNVKNVWNPEDNIFGGSKYLSKMLEKYDGDIEKSLAAYNAGPGNVEKYDGVPPFEETKNYINRVKGYMKYWENEL